MISNRLWACYSRSCPGQYGGRAPTCPNHAAISELHSDEQVTLTRIWSALGEGTGRVRICTGCWNSSTVAAFIACGMSVDPMVAIFLFYRPSSVCHLFIYRDASVGIYRVCLIIYKTILPSVVTLAGFYSESCGDPIHPLRKPRRDRFYRRQTTGKGYSIDS
jgi:hypothetical protein